MQKSTTGKFHYAFPPYELFVRLSGRLLEYRRTGSFHVDIGGPDHRSAFIDFCLDEFLQVLWRAALRRRHVSADLLEALPHHRGLNRRYGCSIEPLYDRSRGAPRQEQGIPDRGVEIG